MRDTIKTVRFDSSFRLKGLDGEQRAGTYEVITTEERVDSFLVDAWKRISTQLRVPALEHDFGQTQYVTISQGDLDDALMSDKGEPVAGRRNIVRN